LSTVEIKLTEMQENLALKNFSHCHYTLNFWQQVPENKYPEFKIPVHNPFLCIAQHIAAIFFSVMKFVKSNHRATLKNEHLGRINLHSFNNVLCRF